ncbi:TIGR04282 family arsenosugar biosynthesis glycosyltransferase [Alteriqipengyuania flavescens]|uniref:TIGR04282 family arsenosugar biosynthesis glycosyltransferase n=1 Tax=Alteriqipengyuania flavescens TaxID=3053610 RepID=UPI0025B3BFE3|nr:TIGR04282 family arsenosugar biosynthesis glycosyltransferase [Alteriqipengyuania flavescens]WJY17825.1 TIGR04282 family arsenosugar biosynthesis glycosyltransferase [Alteriqipengyuania flavescens]WJY23767.1 TIGR04282 family arsenosugar biosynthesis glycosyltransferase [Alteriqipengyuania flavescens]
MPDSAAASNPLKARAMQPRVVIFAKYPKAGAVKTRLAETIGDAAASRVYRALLDHTLIEARSSGLPVELRYDGAEAADFAQLVSGEIDLVPQGGGDLGERLARVEAPALVIGSDCPGLTAKKLRKAAKALAENDAVIGPATDGGYWLIGLARPMPFLFEAMPWSKPGLLAATLSKLDEAGIGYAMLKELGDIDTEDDLKHWPDFRP